MEQSRDKILISELQLRVRIGCSEEERMYPQRIAASLEIGVDTTRSARSKELTDTICYLETSSALAQLVEGRTWVLLEELASDFTQNIFEQFPIATSVRLQLRKYVLVGTAWVGIETFRHRGE